MPDLYFNRVPSLPATDDGSARPLTEDLSTGSGDGEDIIGDADTAEAGEVAAAAGTEPREGEADPGRSWPNGNRGAGRRSRGQAARRRSRAEPEMAGAGMARPDGEAEFTEDDAAFLSATQEADATIAANGTITEDAPGPDAAAAIGESGRWFRPAKAKKKYVPIPPEDQADSAGLDGAPADPEAGGAEATQDRAEQAADPAASMSAAPGGGGSRGGRRGGAGAEGEADAEAEAGA